MTVNAPRRRSSTAIRRGGHVIAVVVNAAMLYVVNVWPGWEAVPFLTADTRQVLGVLNLSLAASLVVNVVFTAYDAPWWRLTSDIVTTGIGLAVLVRIWLVFPFHFSDSSVDWPSLARILLVVAIVGTSMGMVSHLASLLRHLAKGGAPRPAVPAR
jgi:hypothetical protein